MFSKLTFEGLSAEDQSLATRTIKGLSVLLNTTAVLLHTEKKDDGTITARIECNLADLVKVLDAQSSQAKPEVTITAGDSVSETETLCETPSPKASLTIRKKTKTKTYKDPLTIEAPVRHNKPNPPKKATPTRLPVVIKSAVAQLRYTPENLSRRVTQCASPAKTGTPTTSPLSTVDSLENLHRAPLPKTNLASTGMPRELLDTTLDSFHDAQFYARHNLLERIIPPTRPVQFASQRASSSSKPETKKGVKQPSPVVKKAATIEALWVPARIPTAKAPSSIRPPLSIRPTNITTHTKVQANISKPVKISTKSKENQIKPAPTTPTKPSRLQRPTFTRPSMTVAAA